MPRIGLVILLVLAEALAETDPEPVFKEAGEELETGYCFGADYVALYRKGEGKMQLLGNTSNPRVTPEAYKTRINTTHIHELPGFQVLNLRASDSGVFSTECWSDNTVVSRHARYLYVCDQKMRAREILLDSDESTYLTCDGSRDNVTVKWFRVGSSDYKAQLILDTETSQEPLQKELRGLLQLEDKGHSLRVHSPVLQDAHKFYCLVARGKECKSFQELDMPDVHLPVYHVMGEKVVLPCLSTHLRQKQSYWQTPLGQLDSNTSYRSQMQIYVDPENDSLVIPSITLSHSGKYSCRSSLLLKEYLITVCSKLKKVEIQAPAGGSLTLDCDPQRNESANIQWFRQIGDNFVEQIYDSEDPTINPPADLAARMKIEKGTSLKISALGVKESGTYWCVVLLIAEEPISEEDITEYFTEDYDDEESMDTCDLKRVIKLTIHPPHGPDDRADEAGSNLRKYSLVGVGVGVAILTLIGVVLVLKLCAKKNSKTISRPEPQRTELSTPLVSL